MMRPCMCGLAVLLLAATAGADEVKKDKGTTDPAGAPLEAKLVAKQETYTLDLGGKTAAEFRKLLKDAADKGGRLPPPPAVDLVLELRNTGDKDIQVWVEGDPPQLLLDLKGPAAVNMNAGLAFTADFRAPKAVTLAPGKSHTIPIKSLTYGFRGAGNVSYWLEPGEYTLTGTFKTAVAPAPQGAKDARNGFGYVTVTSAPIKIKVEEKK